MGVGPLGAIRAAGRRQGRAGLVAAAAVLVFAVVGIGGPLVGRGSFSASEQVIYRSPWVGELQTPPTDGQSPLNDTYEQIHPAIHEWAARLRDGDLALTSPYEDGGTLLTAWTVDGFVDPLNLPWLLLPADLAPGYTKLLEIAVAAGFMYLFCRRLGTARAPAWIGGLAYAASGFQIAWTNWPHARVGALTPAVFWAIERLVQLRRWRDVSVLALVIAWHFAGGFPSVTVMMLVVAGIYAVCRLLADDRGEPAIRRDRRRMLVGGVMAVVGVGLAVGLMAIQLAGLDHVLSRSDLSNRELFLGAHADKAELATALMPAGLGLPEWGGWVRPGNVIEAQTFVGGAVALLAMGVIVRRRPAREMRGVALGFTIFTALSVIVIFFGGPLLEALQRAVPTMSENYIGRWRSVMGFGIATLAALGANRWADSATVREGSRRWWWYSAAGAAAVLALAFVVLTITPVPAANRPSVRVGATVLACSLAATAVVVWFAKRRPSWGVCLVAPIIAVEALSFALPYWHRTPDELFYPSSPLVSTAGQLQGHDRIEGVAAIGRGLTSWYRLRTATGYAPATTEWADLMTLINPTQPRTTWATEIMTVDQAAQQPALLDRLGVRYLVIGAPVITAPLPADWTPIMSTDGGTLVERQTALSRIRWASTSHVVPDAPSRLGALSAGVEDTVVILERPSGASEGGTGRVVGIDETDSDHRTISVRADGDGYLVMADSFDPWWTVTVDGREAPLLRADHAMMAVAVPAGDHVVEFTYSLPRAPIAVSVMSLAALLGLAGADVVITRRRQPQAKTGCSSSSTRTSI